MKWFEEYIEKNGPYDAVWGFSQGSLLITAALIKYQSEKKTPPFKSAILFSGSPPLPAMEALGFDIPESSWKRDLASMNALSAQTDSQAILDSGGDRWAGSHTGDDASLFAISEEEAQTEIKSPYGPIQLPTVHISGSKDPRFVTALQMSGLYEPSLRKMYNHGGGHEIPRKSDVNTKMADLVQWALEEAGI